MRQGVLDLLGILFAGLEGEDLEDGLDLCTGLGLVEFFEEALGEGLGVGHNDDIFLWNAPKSIYGVQNSPRRIETPNPLSTPLY